MDLNETLKTILLAGVGIVAKTAEVSKNVAEELVQKGAVTVEEGRVFAGQMREKAAEKRAEEILNAVAAMSPEEREALWDGVQRRDAEKAAAGTAEAEGETCEPEDAPEEEENGQTPET